MKNNRLILSCSRKDALLRACDYDLVLVRGVSGSGKSTFARELQDNILGTRSILDVPEIFEADLAFMDQGVYKFDWTKLGKAHDDCHKGVKDRLLRGKPCIVANTLTREFELAPYFDITSQFEGLDVCVVDLYTQFGNVHGVPPEVVNKQALRFIPCDMLPDRFDFAGIKVYDW